MFKKTAFVLVVLLSTNVISNHKTHQAQVRQARVEAHQKQVEAQTAQKLAREAEAKKLAQVQVEAKKPVAEPEKEPEPSSVKPAVTSNVTCRQAIDQVFPAHLRSGAIVVLQHENRKEDPNAIGKMNKNGSRDYGCFQINDKAHKAFFASKNWRDPVHNAQQALAIYNGRGNWTAWYAVRGILW